jgi:hypothetical protein
LDEFKGTEIGHVGETQKIVSTEGAPTCKNEVCDEVCGRRCQGLGIAGEIIARTADVLSKAVQSKSFVILIVQENF